MWNVGTCQGRDNLSYPHCARATYPRASRRGRSGRVHCDDQECGTHISGCSPQSTSLVASTCSDRVQNRNDHPPMFSLNSMAVLPVTWSQGDHQRDRAFMTVISSRVTVCSPWCLRVPVGQGTKRFQARHLESDEDRFQQGRRRRVCSLPRKAQQRKASVSSRRRFGKARNGATGTSGCKSNLRECEGTKKAMVQGLAWYDFNQQDERFEV